MTLRFQTNNLKHVISVLQRAIKLLAAKDYVIPHNAQELLSDYSQPDDVTGRRSANRKRAVIKSVTRVIGRPDSHVWEKCTRNAGARFTS